MADSGKIMAYDVSISLGTGADKKVLGCATTGTLSLSVDTIDTTSKCDRGWAASIPNRKSWEITTDIQVYDDGQPNATMANYQTLYNAWFNGTPLTVTYALPNNTPFGKTGTAWVTKLDVSGGQNDLLTASVTLTGTGPLNDLVATT